MIVLSVGAISLLACHQPVRAVQAQGLTLSPVRAEVDLTAGTVTTGRLTVINDTAHDAVVTMSAEGFTVTDSAYNYSFDPKAMSASWVRFTPSTVTLAPGKSSDVSYTISTPLGAEPGGHYVALFATTSPPALPGEVVTQSRVGSLLYMTVAGDVTRVGKLVKFSVPWLVAGPASWSATIQNAGSAHFRSDVQVTVRTLWNSEVGTVSGSGLILPGSIRLLQGDLPPLAIPGIYKVAVGATMGDKPTTYDTQLVIYMPLYAWFIVAGLGIYIATWLTLRVRARQTAKKVN